MAAVSVFWDTNMAAIASCESTVIEFVYILACPGGIQLPCSRRGNCIDGLEGDGSCVCDTGYNGTACESCIQNSDTCPGIFKKFLLFLSLK